MNPQSPTDARMLLPHSFQIFGLRRHLMGFKKLGTGNIGNINVINSKSIKSHKIIIKSHIYIYIKKQQSTNDLRNTGDG